MRILWVFKVVLIFFLPLRVVVLLFVRKLKLFFTNGERFWCAHNAVFDIAWLQEHGIYLRGRVACTMLASKIFYNGIPKLKHSLKDVAKRVLKIDVNKEEQSSNWGSMDLNVLFPY